MKKILPLVLLLIGTSAGVGAGVFLRPEAAPVPEGMEAQDPSAGQMPLEEQGDPSREYARMSNQFVVPVVKGAAVQGLVVMSLSLEVPVGQKDEVYAREPKIRDSFLQVLFDHANAGGFDGAFTDAANLSVLRGALREVAQKIMGDQITDVLIIEIARQDY